DLVRAGREQHRGAGQLHRAAQDPVGHRLSAPGRLLPGRAADAARAARAAVPRSEAPGARRRRAWLLRDELIQGRASGLAIALYIVRRTTERGEVMRLAELDDAGMLAPLARIAQHEPAEAGTLR